MRKRGGLGEETGGGGSPMHTLTCWPSLETVHMYGACADSQLPLFSRPFLRSPNLALSGKQKAARTRFVKTPLRNREEL